MHLAKLGLLCTYYLAWMSYFNARKYSLFVVLNKNVNVYYISKSVVSSLGVILADQLTLSQPGGQIMPT